MNKRIFIEAYILSVVHGSASSRGMVNAQDLVEEAVHAWNEIEKESPFHPEPSKAKPSKDKDKPSKETPWP
ncbi:MAG: hypothetical protein MN733_03255 [Nitrososphaera sp.]|nr:hypothetical protein [Nitrososphaera sp.]